MRILIVEDNHICCKVNQKILSSYGECDTAVDGEDALHAFKLAYIENRPYDLVCMDIMMPSVNGQESLEQIRAIEKELAIEPAKEVKVIMISALGYPKNVMEAFNGGANAYIVKPINKRILQEKLKELKLV